MKKPINIFNRILNTDLRKIMLMMVLYKLFLELIFINTVSEVFAYVGYEYYFSITRYIVTFILFFSCIWIMPKKEGKISSIFNLVIFLMTIVPLMIIFQYSNFPYWMILSLSLAFVIQSMIINMNIKYPKIKRFKFSDKNTDKALLILCIVCFITFVLQNPLPQLSKISFDKIYQIRADFSYSSVIWSIIFDLFCKILNPLMIIISVKDKKYLKTLLFIFMQGYIYAVTGFKTYLFIIPVVIFIVMFKNRNYYKNILAGFTFGTFGLYILYFITKNIYILALVHNRVLFFPAQIKYAYLDFFSKNEFVNFSQSTIGNIFNINSVYEKSVPNIIGEIYFDKPTMHANTGYLADGYANWGILGMIIMAIALGFILNYLDSITQSYSLKYVLAVFILFAISLNDGALMTCLFSGGMLFAIILFTFVDFDIEKDKG